MCSDLLCGGQYGSIGERKTSTPRQVLLSMSSDTTSPPLAASDGGALVRLLSRGLSPSDSDTSGISSGSDISDTTIVDLMVGRTQYNLPLLSVLMNECSLAIIFLVEIIERQNAQT